MRNTRVYLDHALSVDTDLSIEGEAADHLGRVLRARVGDSVLLFSGDGNDYSAELLSIGRRVLRARVTGMRAVACEPPWPLVLAQALARGDKMDLIVQKATELGATGVVPLLTERSGVRLDPARAEKRVQHWRKIAISACEQCGRARIPTVRPIQTIDAWCATLGSDGMQRLALSPQATQRIRDLTPGPAGVVLVVGPEGGFGDHDNAELTAAGFSGITLGPRILRTETAGLAALAATQAIHGDL